MLPSRFELGHAVAQHISFPVKVAENCFVIFIARIRKQIHQTGARRNNRRKRMECYGYPLLPEGMTLRTLFEAVSLISKKSARKRDYVIRLPMLKAMRDR